MDLSVKQRMLGLVGVAIAVTVAVGGAGLFAVTELVNTNAASADQ